MPSNRGATDINQITAGVPKPLKADVGDAITYANTTMKGKGGMSIQDVSKTAKPTIVYRGAKSAELKTTSGDLGSGYYFTKDKNLAPKYAGESGAVHEYAISPKAKIATINDIPKDVLKPRRLGLETQAMDTELVEWARVNGFDAIDMKGIKATGIHRVENEIRVLNLDILKPKTNLGKPVTANPVAEASLGKLKLTDAYPDNYLGYNLKYLDKVAKEKGYNLYDKMIKLVDSQETTAGKIKGMESIMNDLFKSKTTLGK